VATLGALLLRRPLSVTPAVPVPAV
jgi:hypothetical protein